MGSRPFEKLSLHFIVVQSSILLAHPPPKKKSPAGLAFVLSTFWSSNQIFTLETHSLPSSHHWTVLHNKSASWSHALVLFNPLSAEGHSTQPQQTGCSLYFDVVPALISIGDQRHWLKHTHGLQSVRLCSLILIDHIVFFLLNSFGRLSVLSHPIEAWMGYHAIDKHGFEP